MLHVAPARKVDCASGLPAMIACPTRNQFSNNDLLQTKHYLGLPLSYKDRSICASSPLVPN
jgi:hypothetical protein